MPWIYLRIWEDLWIHSFFFQKYWLSACCILDIYSQCMGWGVKESASNEEDVCSSPESGRCPGEGNSNRLQYSCLEDPMDRGACRATVHGVAGVRHDWVTKPPPPYLYISGEKKKKNRAGWRHSFWGHGSASTHLFLPLGRRGRWESRIPLCSH